MFWWPSIKFIAPALILDSRNNIMRKFHHNLLPRLGINHNIPQVLTAPPPYMGGFDLKSIEIEQIIESISIVVSYFNLTLPTADLIKYSLEYMQLESGWDEPILLADYSKLHVLCTNGWLKSL